MRGVVACAILGVVLVAGCGPTPEEQRAMDVSACSGYGFAPGTDGFANCMMTNAQKRDEQAAANHRAFLARQAADARARDAAEARRAREDAPKPAEAPPPKMKCTSTSTTVGNTTTSHEECHS